MKFKNYICKTCGVQYDASEDYPERCIICEDERQYINCEGEEFGINEDLTIINCGGHFDGSSVLHWKSGDDGRGVMLTGDTIQVVPDRRFVSFIYSYPNLIPLPAEKVRNIVNTIEPYPFNRIYGGFEGRTVHTDGKNAVYRPAERYLKAIG